MPGIPPKPPITDDIFSLLVSRTLVAAALIAAVTRSSSMPTSFGSTTDWSILTRTTSNWPLTVAVTRPPPAAPSHSSFASSSWTRATSPWSFCACFMREFRSGILPLDIGLDLLDLGAKRLEHVLRDRVLAGLGLAAVALGGRLLARGLEHGARGGVLRGIDQLDRDLRRLAERLVQDLAKRVEPALGGVLVRLELRREAELEPVRRPAEHARGLERAGE